jgi:hypothetical protein
MFVSPDYFRTLGLPLRGRDFTADEDKDESGRIMVNETFARRFFPGQEAIGKRVNFTGPGQAVFIGVCGDGKYNSLGEQPKPALYRPILRDYSRPGDARRAYKSQYDQCTGGASRGDAPARSHAAINGNENAARAHTHPAFAAASRPTALGSFGILALVLAAVGIYGVMLCVVGGRIREIGLRVALDAQSRDVRRFILQQGNVAGVDRLDRRPGRRFCRDAVPRIVTLRHERA